MWLPLLLSAFGCVSGTINHCPDQTVVDIETNRCYKFVDQRMSWTSANEFCRATGALLINMENGFENALIREDAAQFLETESSVWIGLSNLLGNWQWINGSIGYSNWAPGEPGNQGDVCAYMDTHSGYWYHSLCTEPKTFICTYIANPATPAKVTTTTTVPPTTTKGPKCPHGLYHRTENNKCYYLGSYTAYWDAESYCMSIGGHLTSILNQEENDYLVDLLSLGGTRKDDEMTWIGLHYTGHDWVWLDGSPTYYMNWEKGEPSWIDRDPCADLMQDGKNWDKNGKGYWNNQRCTLQMRQYVCKIDALW